MRTFAWSSVVTLIAGVVLEQSGDAIATHIGMSGLMFARQFWRLRLRCPSFRQVWRRSRWAITSWRSATSSAATRSCRFCFWWRPFCPANRFCRRRKKRHLPDRPGNVADHSLHLWPRLAATTQNRAHGTRFFRRADRLRGGNGRSAPDCALNLFKSRTPNETLFVPI